MFFQVILLAGYAWAHYALHFLTREAVELYFDFLAENGLLAVHVSSKLIDFEPVGSGLVDAMGISAIIKRDSNNPKQKGKMASKYMIFARSPDQLEPFITGDSGWRPLGNERSLLWTDEHGNVLDAVMW